MQTAKAARTFMVAERALNRVTIPVYRRMSHPEMIARVFLDEQFGRRIMSVPTTDNTLNASSLTSAITKEPGWENNIKWRTGSHASERELRAMLIGRLGDIDCLEALPEARYGGIYIPGRAQLIDLAERVKKEKGYYYTYYTAKVLGPLFRPDIKANEFLSIEQLQELYGGKPIREQTFWYGPGSHSLADILFSSATSPGMWTARGIMDISNYKNEVLSGRCSEYIQILSCDEDAAVLETEIFGKDLAEIWGRMDGKRTIYLIASEAAYQAIKGNNEHLNLEDENGNPRATFGNCNVVLMSAGEHKCGINLDKLPENIRLLIGSTDGERTITAVSGESNNFTMHNFTIHGKKIPHYRFFVCAADVTQKMTGLFWMEEEGISDHPYPVIIKVPADVPGPPAMDFTGVRKVRMTMEQYYRSLARYMALDNAQRSDIVRRMTEHGLSLPESLEGPIKHEGYERFRITHRLMRSRMPFSDFLAHSAMDANLKRATEIVRERGWRLSRRVYEGDKYITVRDPLLILMNETGVNTTVLSAMFPLKELGKSTGINIQECFDLPGHRTILSFPDRLVRLARMSGKEVFLAHTAGYFWPQGLYDGLNAAAPNDFQRVQQLHGLIDGRAHNIDGQMLLSPPVYNKGFIAMTDEGMSFGRWKLPESGKASIIVPGSGNISIEWKNGSVNPFSHGLRDMDVVILTPRHGIVRETDDLEDKAQDRNEAYKKVGSYKMDITSDRINIVIWNNKAYFFDSPAYLQPEGIVISVKKGVIDCRGIEMSDTSTSTYVPYDITFDEGILPQVDGRIEWLYGGLTLFANAPADRFHDSIIDHITDKASLFGRSMQDEMTYLQSIARKNFWSEGWFNELSRLTQTTQLQRIQVRGPRCFLVKTRDHYMPVIIEGKADDFSRGADFGEAIFYGLAELYHHIKEDEGKDDIAARIEFERQIRSVQMMNLDGGASVGIGVVDHDGKYIPISNRGPGPNNGYGSERPIPSLFMYF